jgi:Asp-tRNA(Asn)/Glu-tRNA(Gln) amidotransferase A subunit family amidase
MAPYGRGLRAAAERHGRLRPRDSTSLEREKEDYARDLEKPLQWLRIGLPKEFFGEGLTGEVAAAVEAAIEQLKKLGATTVEVSAAQLQARRSPPTTCWRRPKPRVQPVALRRRALRLPRTPITPTSTTCTSKTRARASAPRSSAAS